MSHETWQLVNSLKCLLPYFDKLIDTEETNNIYIRQLYYSKIDFTVKYIRVTSCKCFLDIDNMQFVSFPTELIAKSSLAKEFVYILLKIFNVKYSIMEEDLKIYSPTVLICGLMYTIVSIFMWEFVLVSLDIIFNETNLSCVLNSNREGSSCTKGIQWSMPSILCVTLC